VKCDCVRDSEREREREREVGNGGGGGGVLTYLPPPTTPAPAPTTLLQVEEMFAPRKKDINILDQVPMGASSRSAEANFVGDKKVL